jgi:hypothetical protein
MVNEGEAGEMALSAAVKSRATPPCSDDRRHRRRKRTLEQMSLGAQLHLTRVLVRNVSMPGAANTRIAR